jgi:hypothetical protein
VVDALALACGNARWDALGVASAADVPAVQVPALPDRSDVDPVLRALDGRRLIVYGEDGALAAVVLRLLRLSLLGEVSVGYVPASASSEVARLWGLPVSPSAAVRLALSGEPERVPLIRDDAGGVLVGVGVLRPVRGVVYCDDRRVLRGQASRLEVRPDPEAGPDTSVAGLTVQTSRVGWLGRRGVSAQGRAVQIGCVQTTPQRDGVRYDRPVTRWTWYRHTEDWRLVRGLV